MIEHKQVFYHKPAEGQVGDCFRTCVACVLNCGLPTDIPHVLEMFFDVSDPDKQIVPQVNAALNSHLELQGLRFFEYPLECDLEQLKTYLAHYLTGQHVIVGCSSKNGGHSVVMRDKDYMWDPSLDSSGCVGPMSDGYYWIGLILKDTSK